jgi:hypothetical protein
VAAVAALEVLGSGGQAVGGDAGGAAVHRPGSRLAVAGLVGAEAFRHRRISWRSHNRGLAFYKAGRETVCFGVRSIEG